MILSGVFTSFWAYLIAPVVGGIAAALLYDRVVAKAVAPTIDDPAADREPAPGSADGAGQGGVPAGDRSLSTGTASNSDP